MPAAGVFDGYRAIRRREGGSGDFDCFPANTPFAASLSVKKYDILSLNAAGALAQSIAAPASGSYTASGGNLPIAGVAMCDFVTDSSGNITTPNQAGLSTNYGMPPVAKFTDLEICMRLWSGTGGTLAGVTLTSTQQDDVLIGYANYQFIRFNSATYGLGYALFTTTTNGEFVVVERALEVVGSALTDNYGLLWCRPAISNTIRQV